MKEIIKKIDNKYCNSFLKAIYIKYFLREENIKKFNKNYVLKISSLRQYKSLTYWNNLFEHISSNKVDGDIIECGVGNGQTLSYILFNLLNNNFLSNKNTLDLIPLKVFQNLAMKIIQQETQKKENGIIQTKSL